LRNHRTAAWLAGALAVALAGCGTADPVPVTSNAASTKTPKALTIYTDLPLAGSSGAIQQSIANGARLALEQWDHRVSYGPRGHLRSFHVYLRSLNDAESSTGNWSQDLTAANAQYAVSKPTTVAYIGDFDSAATAISLQAISPTGILQISPWSPYIGFTEANPADGKGDPARFYPANGPNTFARLVPSDLAEAAATVRYMRESGVTRLYVLGDVSVFDAAIAQLVANDAPASGITVVGLQQGIDTQTNTQPTGYAQIATAVAALRPDAVLLGGKPGAGAVALWKELHTMLPHAKLFAPSTLATPTFLSGIAATPGTTSTTSGSTTTTSSTTSTGSTTSTSSTTTSTSATTATSSTTSTGSTTATSPATRPTSAASATYVTSPILEPYQYPAAAWVELARYRARFKTAPTAYALYGYAAMRDVLLAIRRAGAQATNRAALLKIFFHHLGVIGDVLGRYTINGYGDSSLQSFDGYRVNRSGRLALVRRISS
jgi:branched-chain amino acid transport system substrate-binding protein